MKQIVHCRMVRLTILALFFFTISPASAADALLDKNLKPSDSEIDEVSTVFRDMGVVQRKAITKANKLLLSNYLSMDFSDGPFSMYGVNVDVGYALSDFWEIYLTTAPFFINQKRSIVKKVESLKLDDGRQATLTGAEARRQFGVELLWAPLYGKDSVGLRSVVRSDTFLKVGVMNIIYNQGSGLKFHMGAGKTFFLGRQTGFRTTISANYVETIVDYVKSFKTIVMVETGFVFYLL